MARQYLNIYSEIVEVPFITIKFGGEEFGLTSEVDMHTGARRMKYITSLTISRNASGMVNTYTATLEYPVEPGTDPNYINYVISRDTSREIIFEYGDLSQPSFSYKSEKAIITNIRPSFSFSGGKITYTIEATSSVAILYSLKREYGEKVAKPSDVIFELLYLERDNGLLELFEGMKDRTKVEQLGLIARDDIEVTIAAKSDISPLEYLRYLVGQMRSTNDTFYALLLTNAYTLDSNLTYGNYFEVINSGNVQVSGEMELDIGYLNELPILDFSVSENTSYALITPLHKKYDWQRVINVNDEGDFDVTNMPSILLKKGKADALLVAWWKNMTSFPVSANLTTRGLILPAILCKTLKINVLFYGIPHVYSGTYMVVSQNDTVSGSGFRTSLGLIRVKGEEKQ